VRILFVAAALDPPATPEGTGPGRRRPASAPVHYRLELPCDALRLHGGHDTTLVGRVRIDPEGGRLVGEAPDGRVVDDAELVVLQGFVPADSILRARRAGQVVVCDVTDTPEVPESSLYFPLVESMRAAALAMYHAADAVTVSSAYLQRYLATATACPPVHLLRNAVKVDEWGEGGPVADKPTIGWCGTLLERADDCSVLRPWLGAFVERHDLRVVHVGDGAMGVPGWVRTPPSFADAAGVDPERVERRPVRTYADYLATRPWRGIDVQLVPLMDHHYSRGKSCLKGLEATAQGIAFVASPHEEYRWLGCGRLAGTNLAEQPAARWIAALEQSLDSGERISMVGRARDRVASQDIGVRWVDWERTYADILHRRRS
jgi:hypothetical protein